MRKCGQALPEWVANLPDRQQATVKSLYNQGWNAVSHTHGRVAMTFQGWGSVRRVFVHSNGMYWL